MYKLINNEEDRVIPMLLAEKSFSRDGLSEEDEKAFEYLQ
jgi:hypothetical protein